ncbi:MAG: ABC transporter ATP-binding protein [Lachnospiraceae bacterium]|nr:ABC transporter ATP-binding protein [Lachnospiraceae bacterium]
MSEREHFVNIENLTVQYTSGGAVIHAVNDVSMHLNKGETLGLVGETGAGKTTIAKAIMRILPDPPAKITGGEIFVDGEDLLKKPEKEMLTIRGKKIAMIFQDPMTALNPVMTIGNQISEVVKLHNNCSKQEAMERTIEMLEMVGIPRERYIEYPHQFSGGMKQRVVIAMALACDPELLLADEPTTALDVTIQAQVLEMINDLKKKFNTAMILITHDLGVVAETCDNVAVIYAGEIVEYADKMNLFLKPTHPYTLGLFGSVPKLNDEEDRLSPIPGLPPDPTRVIAGCAFAERCPYATEECKKAKIEMREIETNHFSRCIRNAARGGDR